MKASGTRIIGSAVLLVAVGAWIFWPALSGLRIGKDKDVTKTANTFRPYDPLYAVVNVNRAPEGARVAAQLVILDVAGLEPGPVRGFDMTIDLLPGMKTASFDFMPPLSGWPNGKYKFQITMLDK